MRLLVCGGRNYNNEKQLREKLNIYHLYGPINVLISGGATGADTLAREYAVEHNVEFLEFKADWLQYGRSAGAIRNKQMLDEGKPDIVIAFPGGKGTANMIAQAEKAGVKVIKIT